MASGTPASKNHVSCRRRSYLPQDLCVREGVADEDVLRGQNSEHVSNVAFEVAKQAKVPQQLLAKSSTLHAPKGMSHEHDHTCVVALAFADRSWSRS